MRLSRSFAINYSRKSGVVPLNLTALVAGPQSGTLSQILSGTRPSVQTVSDACLRHLFSRY